jgi:AcrR family transcriptional regulator
MFAKNSYAATTTREISKAIGITNGTFHHHFPTKEALLFAICERSFLRIERAVRKAIDGVDDDVVRLRSLIQVYLSVIFEDRDLHKTALVDMRSLEDENLRRAEESVAEVQELVREVVGRGRERGVFRTDIGEEDLVLMLLNLINWPLFWVGPKNELQVKELEAAAATLFLDGARAEAAAKAGLVA